MSPEYRIPPEKGFFAPRDPVGTAPHVRRAASLAMSEDELLTNVMDMAHLLGWRTAHFRPARTEEGWRTAGSGDAKGFPDLCMVHPVQGRIVVAELKSQRGQVSEDQAAWIADLGALPDTVEVHVWRPLAWIDGTIESVLRGAP